MAINQQQVTDHFMSMAKGNHWDEDMSSGGKHIAGRKSSRMNYRMLGKPSTPAVTNVTSSIATVVDQASAMIQKGKSPRSSDSRKRKHRSDNTSESPKKKRKRKRKKQKTVSVPTQKKKKKKKKKKK